MMKFIDQEYKETKTEDCTEKVSLYSKNKEVFASRMDNKSKEKNNEIFNLQDDFIEYVEKFKEELKNKTKKEPYIVLLNAILDKKIKDISIAFEEDRKEILNKIVVESLNRSIKNILTNIYSKEIIDKKIDYEKVKNYVQNVF